MSRRNEMKEAIAMLPEETLKVVRSTGAIVDAHYDKEYKLIQVIAISNHIPWKFTFFEDEAFRYNENFHHLLVEYSKF